VLPSLNPHGYQAEVAALWAPYELAPVLLDLGVGVHLLDIPHRWNLWRGAVALAELLRSERFDVVHAHLSFAALYAALTRTLAPAPRRVVTFHNQGYDSYPAVGAWRRSRKAAEARLTRTNFDAYVAVSRAVAEHYRHHFALVRPVRIIPNAIALTTLTSISEGLSQAAGTEPLVIAAGRLVPEKGHKYLISALAELRSLGHRPRVLIVGDGPLRRDISTAVLEQGLADQVTMQPSLPWPELMRLIGGATVLVLASTHEGFPLIPAEAMGLGTPVVATAVGGVPELIEDGTAGVLVPPRDPGGLARALARVLEDPALQHELAAGGRLRVQAFTPDAVACLLARLYDGILS
jgi:glycosyltransferase involved in cell wall biosynthesis